MVVSNEIERVLGVIGGTATKYGKGSFERSKVSSGDFGIVTATLLVNDSLAGDERACLGMSTYR